ncbi:MAG: T9SS type A sorting domain-containing protein, partial [bacterium]
SIDLQLYYLYVLPIINPYALYPDSVFYAAIYGDATISVLGLPVVHIWTGLYKIHKLDSTASWTDYLTVYTRLGDIDNTVSGNTLDLAVPWSLLTADADFGSFGMGQLIVTGFGIATLAVYEKNPGCWVAMPADSFVYAINDRSVSVGLYLKTGRYTISSSMPPRLSDYGASADTGGWQFYCTYTDPEGDLPVIREAVINGISYRLGSLDHVYSDGARFSTILGSVSGDGWYFFRFSDGANIVTTDTLRLALYVENLPYTKHLPIIVENPFPNPFNSSIVVPVVVYKEGIVSALEIYNLQGVLVDKIPLLFKDTGRQEIIWQPKNNLPSGIYLIRLKGENLFGIRKVVLIR